jgi:hypothetical protein
MIVEGGSCDELASIAVQVSRLSGCFLQLVDFGGSSKNE